MEQQPARGRSLLRRSLSILLGIALICGLLYLTFIGYVMLTFGGVWTNLFGSTPDLARVSEISGGVAFPHSARLTDSHFVRWFQGGEVWARVEMDPADVRGFVRSLPPTMAMSRKENLAQLRMKDPRQEPVHDPPSWWKADSARKFIAIRLKGEVQSTRYILISLDDARRAVVYLDWGEL